VDQRLRLRAGQEVGVDRGLAAVRSLLLAAAATAAASVLLVGLIAAVQVIESFQAHMPPEA
jgi:hypothetical protein